MRKTFERHGFFVSRETLEKFEIYDRLLQKWQKAINLVGPTTVEDAAERHFLDSAQLIRYIPDVNVRLADMGSGAGFPGLVLAMLGIADVHLIESDVRKATFLREVSRETGTIVNIHDQRVEDVRISRVDVVTARALAPLKDLLKMMARIRTPETPCYGLFLKGLQHQQEIEDARKKWQCTVETYPSMTDLSGRIIKVSMLDSLPCALKQ